MQPYGQEAPRRKLKKRERPTVRQKLRRLQVPGAPGLRVVDGWPEGSEQGTSGGGYLDGTIYNPGGVLDAAGIGHESFHGLDRQYLTDADRERLLQVTGMSGPWRRGSGMTAEGLSSPSEVLADWYMALTQDTDPKREWAGGYAGTPPTRRQLLRYGRALERMGRRYGLPEYAPPSG